MTRTNVKPEILRWARERSQLPHDKLVKKFPKLQEWESGKLSPTFKQLKTFANATYVPYGFMFLPEPPDLDLPIADFRTLKNTRSRDKEPREITLNLLDTIHAMQRRQAWLTEERMKYFSPLDFVGSASLSDNPETIGQEMRRLVGLEENWADKARNWSGAVSTLREAIEALGVIAVINGVVGNNTHRKLDVEEFRGFALVDEWAPLIFANGADTKSAQMFTLAHELAHVWLGEQATGLSGFDGIFPNSGQDVEVEMFCDQVAAEFLVPKAQLRAWWADLKPDAAPPEAALFEELARQFKVSPIVIGRRAMDLKLVGRKEFFGFYDEYTQREINKNPGAGGTGGDFYNNQNLRVGKRFATSVIWAAKEGSIGFLDAYKLTGLKGGTFHKYAKYLGIELP